ncbi:peptidase family M49-domain-containing protein [Xylariaceae sp. FL0255]|nr:peptidase family M49-domain-containing protein [Xylariaceae sp. FL0255]
MIINQNRTMDRQSQIYRLDVNSQFQGLTDKEKLYAYYMARAAWSGTRIILRQVSPESEPIFDFILKLRKSCKGEWRQLVGPDVTEIDVTAFLEYAATFLSNIGNYYKFVPKMSPQVLRAIASKDDGLMHLLDKIEGSMFAVPPYSLGLSKTAQSSYYVGEEITKDEIANVTQILDAHSIHPENTRIKKTGSQSFEVLQASVDVEAAPKKLLSSHNPSLQVHLVGGDHAADLRNVCENLARAKEHAANDIQRKFLTEYIGSFTTGSLHVYRDSQRSWVSDKAPKVENILGFVEPYRDPYGVRAEFEGLVAIADAEETKLLSNLVEHSDTFIRKLPWVSPENNGKGLFEKSLFDPLDFSSIHALAYCSSIIFPGINLPNDTGFKNVIIANRMVAESTAIQWPFIPDDEMELFKKHKYPAYYCWVVLHELLGHGTGRMMTEESPGKFNFDIDNPPLSPLDGTPIKTWYKPGQTWTGQFGDLATTVDECRAELVGAFLMDDAELLRIFGFTEDTEIIASDQVTYNLYQQLGVDGLRGLANFNVEDMKWGQAHSRAHFAMLMCLLRNSDGCVQVEHDEANNKLTVRVDRSKIVSHGKKALGEMLLRLHMYRCTADVQACRGYYEDLSHVDDERLRWRKTVLLNTPSPLLNVQANTFMDGDTVVLKEYETTYESIIDSWYERGV